MNGHRILSSYERIAQQEHWCQKCQGPILPGELYHGTVHANRAIVGGKLRKWV